MLALYGRLVAGLARSFLLHRLLKRFVRNGLVRLLLEAVVIPTVVDSRPAQWLQAQLHRLWLRVQHLREQAAQAARAAEQEASAERPRRAAPDDGPRPGSDGQKPDGPAPSNRAERRAQRRENGGKQSSEQ